MKIELNEGIARKVLTAVDAGLVKGVGIQEPGKMCVEAAVCFALGLPHGDNPPCVGSSVRRVKIGVNDSNWSSIEARAEGMRRVAIAQLGSDTIDQREFLKRLSTELIRQIVPIALRAAASVQKSDKHKEALNGAAQKCVNEPTEASARSARKIAYAAAAAAADAYADAAYAAYAADAAADAYADAAYAAAAAADAAAYAADAAAAEKRAQIRDDVLGKVAEIIVQILIAMKSPGCEWLSITEGQ